LKNGKPVNPAKENEMLYALIAVLLAVVAFLLYKLPSGSTVNAPALPTRGKYITAREVPSRLVEMFETEYGGASRIHDDNIEIGFRFAKFHQKYDNADYPIDATITMHRGPYLEDPTVKTELAALLTKLEGIGLDFVACYGRHASATTEPFREFVDNGGIEHGQWTPSAAAAVKTRLGRDEKGKFSSVVVEEEESNVTAKVS
jgi:hypothetical protein